MRHAWFYIIVFATGILVREGCSVAFDMLDGTTWGEQIIRGTYSYKEFIFWIGEPFRDLIWTYGFWTIIKDTRFGKYLVRLYFDWLLTDIGFLIFSDPYIFNRSKWACMLIAFTVFIIHCILLRKNKTLI